MRIVVTGATGFVGSALVPVLRERGDHVVALTRDVERAKTKLPDVELVEADLETPGPWCDALEGAGAIVHLAGEHVTSQRWNAKFKQRIRDSRVETTRTIVEAIGKLRARPQALVTASGTDYYAFDDDDVEITETAAPGDTFLARVSRDWEKEALAAEALGVRVCCIRTGLPLAKGGEATVRLRRPFVLLAGGPLGGGKQWVSWIHLDDLVAIYANATVDARYRGPLNAVADSVRNAEFARAFGRAVHRPSWLPAPAFAVKIVLGEFAESVLNGRRVVPAKLRELGYTWKHPDLDEAMRSSV